MMSIPTVGSNDFFARLLTIFHTTVPFLDPVIAQSILLCLIAGNNHLILRCPEKDIGLVVKFATLTLSSIFNYQTHKLKIRPSSNPATDPTDSDHFLRSLFLPSHNSKDSRSRSINHRVLPNVNVSRSHSFPNELAGDGREALELQIQDPVTDPSPSAFKFKIKTSQSKSKLKSKFDRYADSSPTPTDGVSDLFQHPLELPRALVMSGLENAGIPAQRALVEVLRERRVVLNGRPLGADGDEGSDGAWNLPDGFIMVYVCPWDPRERPPIHKSLLDRFAMSATVTLHPSTRHALNSASFSFSNSSGSNFRPPTSPSSPLSSLDTPPFSTQTLLYTLRGYHKQVHLASNLSLYTSDLFSAARHHPQLDGTLLSSLARRDADALIAAARVLGLGGEVTVPLVEDSVESETSDGEWPWLGSEVRVLDVSEADVARIVPRVVSHRLRVRDGPEDEVLWNAVFGAVGWWKGGEEPEPESERVRSTVKDILVQILSEV